MTLSDGASGGSFMIVEIHEILIQKEKLSYPCDQLTVGFISEAEFQANRNADAQCSQRE